MIGWFTGKSRQALREASVALATHRATERVMLDLLGVSIVIVSGQSVVVDIRDPLGLFGSVDRDRATLGGLVMALGGTREIRDALDMVITRCQTDVTTADAQVDPPVIAIPAPADSPEASVRWISIKGQALTQIQEKDQKEVGVSDDRRIVLIFRDITQARLRDDGLERKVALMNRALDRAPFGLVVLGADGAVRDTNTAFRRLIGGQSASGRKFTQLFQPEDQGRLETMLHALAEAPGDAPAPTPIDLRLVLPADRTVTIYANRTIIPDQDRPGTLIHAIDSTERKRLESQFAQSQKMEAVGQLAGGIAHDFNNVLTAIIGFCDLLLQRHQPGDPSFADVMQIQQNANRAAGLTRQLLAFSRQQSIRTRLIDVTDTIAELSNLLRRLLGESIELTVVHGRDLWPIRGDRGQLEQVIINLAVNARDAMERGGRLIVQTDNFTSSQTYQMREQVMPAGDYVMITVTDTGTGMTAEVMARIFEPFFTTKEVGQGTGLGLAMVYGSVTQIGGFVAVHSEGTGKGTSFSLYLPRAKETERDIAEAARGSASEMQETDDTGGERILLVEDEDAVRLFSARALRSKGYEVVEARTGEVALELLADQSFDLMVTDMVMPKVDGATLIREARKTMPDMPVICISGYTRESVAKEVAELPRVSFLSKPFSLKQLSGRVRAALESGGEVD